MERRCWMRTRGAGPSVLSFFFSSRRRHTRFDCDWSSDVCSSDLDGHLPQRQRIPDEGGRPGEAEHVDILRRRRQRPARDVGAEKADDEDVHEPLHQIRGHRAAPGRQHRHDDGRTPLHLFHEFGRAHFGVAGGPRDHVITRRDVERAERVHDAILIVESRIVRLVPERPHVDDGAHHEHHDGGEQNRQPQRGQRGHLEPPGGRGTRRLKGNTSLMRSERRCHLLPAIVVSCALWAGPLHAVQLDTVSRPRPLMALGQTVVLNTLVNRLDVWARDKDWARVGTRTWARNIRYGWAWDEDAFPTNVFAHPYHGGLYFNAGRENGLDFFESVPVTLFGALTWEYFAETERPSLNDFLMTSVGGVAMGEMFYRISATIRDNEATGARRTWREVATLLFDPIGALNRLFRGQWKTVAKNPDEHMPDAYVLRVGAGARFAKELVNDG